MSDISRLDSMTDYSPLSQACIKALTDRMDDKRKFAANEIEKMTVDFSMSNNLTMVNRLIIVLGRKFCLSHQQNTRKGGLLGLAAVMVGFKNGSIQEPPAEMVEEVVRPVLTCLLDSDPRVRQCACEALYNVTKVARASILALFELVFDSLTKMVADNDILVRSGAELMDRLLKDIFVESNDLFKVDTFVTKLEEYIYTRNAYTRMFIISWIRLLDSKIDMIKYLPHLLDGIFTCLYDGSDEIRASILVLLSEFLNKIVTRPTDEIDLSSLVNTLLKHTRNDREGPVQYTAIAWIRQIIRLMDGPDLLTFTPGILSAILPCLAYQRSEEFAGYPNATAASDSRPRSPMAPQYIPSPADQDNIREISTLVNSSLLELVINVVSDRKNTSNLEPIYGDLEDILEELSKELQKQDHPLVKLAILDWFKALKEAESEYIPAKISQPKMFQPLLDTLSAHSDAVVKSALRVITEIFRDDTSEQEQSQQLHQRTISASSSGPNVADNENTAAGKDDVEEGDRRKIPLRTQQPKSPGSVPKRVAITTSDNTNFATPSSGPNIQKFIQALYRTFRENETVFDERGTFILLNLCSMVKAERVYGAFAEMIKEERTDLRFAYNLVQKLNQILLTTQPLFSLRSRLSNDDDHELANLFQNLYLAWCHSPIATITLCLLTNNYRHASEIVTALARTDINVELLIQIDWIVQLIESPVFAPLRMRLLDSSSNQYLLQALYGLLMILPQSDAYRRLSSRMDQVQKFMSTQANHQRPAVMVSSASSSQMSASVHKSAASGGSGTSSGKDVKELKRVPTSATNLDSLMKHFHNIQHLRTKQLVNRNADVDV